MTSTETEIKALLDTWSAAVAAKDVDGLMTLYAPDIVYFDVVPPLRFSGTEAVRKNFRRWFDIWASGIKSESRDLRILASGDTAIAFKLHRASGTRKDGREIGLWVRVTVACRRVNDRWLITHEHVSVPVEMPGGRAVIDAVP
jgi:uncharacterized protein (TIGR02246 family)